MKTLNKISQRRINRIKEQGYFNFSNYEIMLIAFGNRFAFILCTTLLYYGVITSNVLLLKVMLGIAFGGIILPYHPFDYIYNYIIRHLINRPKLPRRSVQLKLACAIATIFISATISLFISGYKIVGYSVAACLLFSATLVSITDICIPSIIYNKLNKKRAV